MRRTLLVCVLLSVGVVGVPGVAHGAEGRRCWCVRHIQRAYALNTYNIRGRVVGYARRGGVSKRNSNALNRWLAEQWRNPGLCKSNSKVCKAVVKCIVGGAAAYLASRNSGASEYRSLRNAEYACYAAIALEFLIA